MSLAKRGLELPALGHGAWYLRRRHLELCLRRVHLRRLSAVLRGRRSVLGHVRVVRDLRRIHVRLSDQLTILELLALTIEVSLAVHDGHFGLHGLRWRDRDGGARVLEVCLGLGSGRLLAPHGPSRSLELSLGLIHLGLEDRGVNTREVICPLVTCELEVRKELLLIWPDTCEPT